MTTVDFKTAIEALDKGKIIKQAGRTLPFYYRCSELIPNYSTLYGITKVYDGRSAGPCSTQLDQFSEEQQHSLDWQIFDASDEYFSWFLHPNSFEILSPLPNSVNKIRFTPYYSRDVSTREDTAIEKYFERPKFDWKHPFKSLKPIEKTKFEGGEIIELLHHIKTRNEPVGNFFCARSRENPPPFAMRYFPWCGEEEWSDCKVKSFTCITVEGHQAVDVLISIGQKKIIRDQTGKAA